MSDLEARSVVEATVGVTVIRADGTVQEYGEVAAMSAGFRQRLHVALRTRRLNSEARSANPEVPRTRLLPMIRFIFFGGN